jgi:hypothetical protein
METYSVYITQNLLDLKKAYVGMTNGHNKKYMGSSPTLKKDIKLLGKENFSKTILGTFTTWQECHYWEGFYVKTLKTHISQGGYNEYWDGGRYILMTKEIRHKISESEKGKIVSKETGLKISKSKLGHFTSEESKEKNRQGHLGKTHTEESKEKCRISSTGRKHTEKICKQISKSIKLVPKIKCFYCDKMYSPWTYARWHGERCKNNGNI